MMVLFGRDFCDFCRDSVHTHKKKTAQYGLEKKKGRKKGGALIWDKN